MPGVCSQRSLGLFSLPLTDSCLLPRPGLALAVGKAVGELPEAGAGPSAPWAKALS